MYDFQYSKAQLIADAAARLKATDGAKLLAGGMTLLPTIKLRLAKPAELIDLGTLADLKGIDVSDGTVRRDPATGRSDAQSATVRRDPATGRSDAQAATVRRDPATGRSDAQAATVTVKAMTRHADVARSAAVAKSIPALAALAGGIGDVQVRHRGTIGGSVANNDPAADYPAACLGLGATIVTSRREIAADDFFKALFTTALEPDEIITAIRFPVPEKAAYMKFKNPASRYAIVGAFVAKGPQGVRVAITGAGDSGVFRVTAMEQALSRSFDAKAIEGITVPTDSMLSDIHASAEYRAHLVGVMARRAVAACG